MKERTEAYLAALREVEATLPSGSNRGAAAQAILTNTIVGITEMLTNARREYENLQATMTSATPQPHNGLNENDVALLEAMWETDREKNQANAAKRHAATMQQLIDLALSGLCRIGVGEETRKHLIKELLPSK